MSTLCTPHPLMNKQKRRREEEKEEKREGLLFPLSKGGMVHVGM